MNPAVPWTHKEVTRAKYAYDVQQELLMAGTPLGWWFAVSFDTGKAVSDNGQACWPTKQAAVQWIHSHRGDPNQWLFVQLPHDGIPRSWQSIAATLRLMEQVETYWRANGDPELHIHVPVNPLVSGEM